MSWITLTQEEVTSRLTAAEATALKAKAGDLGPIIANVTRELRGYCGKWVKLGAAGTIPDELQDMAIIVCRYRWLSVLPLRDSSALIEGRKSEYDSTMVALRNVVAKGDFAMVPPDAPDERQAGNNGVEIANLPRREEGIDAL